MLRTARTSILALMVVAAGVAANAQTASAAGKVGVTTIENKLGRTVKFAHRSGSNPWQIRTLKPGESLRISWEYATNLAVSPQLQVMMDVDMTADTFLKTFNLERYVEPSRAFAGKMYQVRYTSLSGRFVAPYAVN